MRLILTTTLMLSLAPLAAFAKDCESGAESMAAVRECLAQQGGNNMQKAYQGALKRAQRKGAPAATQLRAGQAAWKKKAQAQCNAQSKTAGADAYPEDIYQNCMADAEAARIKVLKAYR